MVTLLRLVQYLNARSPILVTLLPMVTLVRLVQQLNASLPILVTLLGMVMLVRLVQFRNAPSPILVTLLGIVILVRFVQSSKASNEITVTALPSYFDGITISATPLAVPTETEYVPSAKSVYFKPSVGGIWLSVALEVFPEPVFTESLNAGSELITATVAVAAITTDKTPAIIPLVSAETEAAFVAPPTADAAAAAVEAEPIADVAADAVPAAPSEDALNNAEDALAPFPKSQRKKGISINPETP